LKRQWRDPGEGLSCWLMLFGGDCLGLLCGFPTRTPCPSRLPPWAGNNSMFPPTLSPQTAGLGAEDLGPVHRVESKGTGFQTPTKAAQPSWNPTAQQTNSPTPPFLLRSARPYRSTPRVFLPTSPAETLRADRNRTGSRPWPPPALFDNRIPSPSPDAKTLELTANSQEQGALLQFFPCQTNPTKEQPATDQHSKGQNCFWQSAAS